MIFKLSANAKGKDIEMLTTEDIMIYLNENSIDNFRIKNFVVLYDEDADMNIFFKIVKEAENPSLGHFDLLLIGTCESGYNNVAASLSTLFGIDWCNKEDIIELDIFEVKSSW